MSYQDVSRPQSDAGLAVQFYNQLWQNHAKSIEEGRPIFEDKTFIKIAVPGNSLTMIDTLAEEHYIERFPEHYKRFKESISTDEPLNGTPLSQWPLVTRAQSEKLRYLKFTTVEHIAQASDQQLQAIGMSVGMSPFEFQKLAKSYLESSKDHAKTAKQTEEINTLRQDNEDLRVQAIANDERIRKMEQQLASLAAAQLQNDTMPQVKRRTRKSKDLQDLSVDPIGENEDFKLE